MDPYTNTHPVCFKVFVQARSPLHLSHATGLWPPAEPLTGAALGHRPCGLPRLAPPYSHRELGKVMTEAANSKL